MPHLMLISTHESECGSIYIYEWALFIYLSMRVCAYIDVCVCVGWVGVCMHIYVCVSVCEGMLVCLSACVCVCANDIIHIYPCVCVQKKEERKRTIKKERVGHVKVHK